MNLHSGRCLASILALVSLLGVSASAIDPSLAQKYFNDAKQISDNDGGKLWGKPLYGPMMFVDRETREVIANQADAEGKLAAKDPVYVGTLPRAKTSPTPPTPGRA